MDEALVVLHRVLERVRDLLPEIELRVDDRGQLVLYTGLFLRDRPEARTPRPEDPPS